MTGAGLVQSVVALSLGALLGIGCSASGTRSFDGGGSGGATGSRDGSSATGGASSGGRGAATGGAANGTGTGGADTGGAGTGGAGSGGRGPGTGGATNGGAGGGGAGTGGVGSGGAGSGGAGSGGRGGATMGTAGAGGRGGIGAGGGAAGAGGGSGVSYAGCSFVGGIDRIAVLKHDTGRDLCAFIVFANGTNTSQITLPAGWRVEYAGAISPAGPCAGRTPALNAVLSTGQTGTASWTSAAPSWPYGVATIDVTLAFAAGAAPIMTSERLQAAAVDVRTPCQ
ncbi:MAG: hypothetical protein ABUL67_00130 [Haliangium ochraceum]